MQLPGSQYEGLQHRHTRYTQAKPVKSQRLVGHYMP